MARKPKTFYYLFDPGRKRRIRQSFDTIEEAQEARRLMGTILEVHSSTNPRGKPLDRKDFSDEDN